MAQMAELFGAVRRYRLAIFSIAMLTITGWLLWSARGALPAFVIGLALAFVLDPGVTALHRQGVPRWLGVLSMYALLVAIVTLIVAYAVPPIARQANEFIEHLPALGAAVDDIRRGFEDWYDGLALPGELRRMIDDSVINAEVALADLLQGVAGPLLDTILRAATFVLGLVIVPIWLFFVLKDRDRLPDAVAGALPPTWRPDALNLVALLGRIGGKWVRGQLLLGASVFVATVFGITLLTLLGFRELGQFTLVLALIAGVLEWFPIIGPIVAAVPAILIAATISPTAVIAVVILYTAIQQLENNLLVPKVMGDAVELHPAVLILALVIGGALFGLGGAILAAPVVAASRDLYRYGFIRMSGEVPSSAFDLVTGRYRRRAPAEAASAATGPASDAAPEPTARSEATSPAVPTPGVQAPAAVIPAASERTAADVRPAERDRLPQAPRR
jgi:predicted PurR-regulated permease PerM